MSYPILIQIFPVMMSSAFQIFSKIKELVLPGSGAPLRLCVAFAHASFI